MTLKDPPIYPTPLAFALQARNRSPPENRRLGRDVPRTFKVRGTCSQAPHAAPPAGTKSTRRAGLLRVLCCPLWVMLATLARNREGPQVHLRRLRLDGAPRGEPKGRGTTFAPALAFAASGGVYRAPANVAAPKTTHLDGAHGTTGSSAKAMGMPLASR
jgi:hypothetical protein